MANNALSSISFWMNIVELILGLICFILFTYFGAIVCLGGVVISRECWLRYNISAMAAVAYPFIIQVALLAGQASNSEAYLNTIVGPLFTIAGFIVYVVGGSIQVYYANYHHTTPHIATGAMFIFTGLVHLVDLILGLAERRKRKEYDLGPLPPLESTRL